MIDTTSPAGSYADKFKDAPTHQALAFARQQSNPFTRLPDWYMEEQRIKMGLLDVVSAPRCYRDRDARTKLVDTTNKLRAGLGWQPWEPGA